MSEISRLVDRLRGMMIRFSDDDGAEFETTPEIVVRSLLCVLREPTSEMLESIYDNAMGSGDTEDIRDVWHAGIDYLLGESLDA